MIKKIKVVLVGPGLIGKTHLELLSKNTRAEIAGIITPDVQKYKKLGERYGCKIYADLASAADCVNFDCVIVSSPTNMHKDHLKTALRYTKTILVEKPVFSESSNLTEFKDFDLKNVMVGHHRHHGANLREVAGYISEIGDLVGVSLNTVFFKPDYYFDEGIWRLKREGGGIVSINLIHDIGILRQVCGEISRVSAFASTKRKNSEVEDTVTINLEFENGALGSIFASDRAVGNLSWEHNSGENTAYPQSIRSNFKVFGTHGMLEFPNVKLTKYSGCDRDWWNATRTNKYHITVDNPLDRQLNEFLDVAQGLKQPTVNIYDGYKNLKVIEAIISSVGSHLPVGVKYEI